MLTDSKNSRLFKFARHLGRYCYEGWLIVWAWFWIVLCAIASRLLAIANIYPFLAANKPLAPANALVVEGWLSDMALKRAVDEFQQGAYQLLIVTSCPLLHGYYLSDCENFADLKTATLIKLGIEPNRIVSLAVPKAEHHRTITAAMTLRDWLLNEAPTIRSINVYTVGPHARRSWKLFQRVLEPTVRVGIIAAPPLTYDPDCWWTSSEGARSVISETIGYTYAILLNRAS